VHRAVADILSEPGREWTSKRPADENQIAELSQNVGFELPAEYIELLRFCDGGYGELDAQPLLFEMDSIAAAVEHNQVWREQGQFCEFWFIGGNGGLELIAFDLRTGPPWSIVMIDPIAGPRSAERIADSMPEFILRIGLRRYHDDSSK
jgi:hypothetical protein